MIKSEGKELKNQTFVYIYAIAIIMVIDDHCSRRIGINSAIFPYNSFYMPLFVFCSGYFFKIRSFKDTLIHRIKKLLVPYIFYDIAMTALAFIIDKRFKTNWYRNISLKSVILLILDRPTTGLNGAAWFVVMLFWVSIAYCLIRNIISDKKSTDYIITFILTVCGFISLYICICFSPVPFPLRWLCRTVFYLQFYHLGYMFRTYFESYLKKQKRVTVCSICIAVNVLLILIFGDSINFYSTQGMGYFSNVFLPLITSVSGIIFYYEVMSFAAETIGERRGISFIARNTFVIMQVHLLFLNKPNLYIFYQVTHGSDKYPDFPVESFINSTWIRYSPNSRLVGFFSGLIGSLLVAYALEQLKERKKILKNDT